MCARCCLSRTCHWTGASSRSAARGCIFSAWLFFSSLRPSQTHWIQNTGCQIRSPNTRFLPTNSHAAEWTTPHALFECGRDRKNFWAFTWMKMDIDLIWADFNSSPPTQNDSHFADDIFRNISVSENFVFWLKFHWSLLLRTQLTITQHWLR